MNPVIKSKLKLLVEFCLFGILAGIIFQMLQEGVVNYIAVIMGMSLAFGFWVLELFILAGLRKKFLKLPLLLTIFIKAFVYLLIINIFSGLVGLIVGYFKGFQME